MESVIYKILKPDEETENWNQAVNHPMQSYEWASFRSRRQQVSRLGVYEKEKLIRGYLIVWSRIKFTPWNFGYAPMTDLADEDDIEEIKQLGKQNGAVGIRLEPEALRIKINKNDLVKTRRLFKPQTRMISLLPEETELLKDMHPKARYNIRLAERHGVTAEENNSETAFTDYLRLTFEGTAKRQGIHLHSPGYHRQMWEELRKTNLVSLWIAKYEGKTIAADLIFKFKKKIYYAYGATALEHKEVMAPTLLLWKIIQAGKREGKTDFDLWGAETGKGFSRFKEQFGGKLISLPDCYDLKVNRWLYPGFRVAEEMRWRMLHLWR